MKVIARKRKSIGIMYLSILFLGTLSIIFGVASGIETVPTVLFGITMIVIGSIPVIQYYSLPEVIISLDDYGTLHFPKGKKAQIEDVTDVVYRRASGRGLQYKWGSVTIITKHSSYKYGYIAECEEVAKTLTRLRYELR